MITLEQDLVCMEISSKVYIEACTCNCYHSYHNYIFSTVAAQINLICLCISIAMIINSAETVTFFFFFGHRTHPVNLQRDKSLIKFLGNFLRYARKIENKKIKIDNITKIGFPFFFFFVFNFYQFSYQ